MCIATYNSGKITKNPLVFYFEVAISHVRTPPLEKLSAVLVMISGKSMSICNLSRAISNDSSRNRAF